MASVRTAIVINLAPDAKRGGLICHALLIEADSTKVAKEPQPPRNVEFPVAVGLTVDEALALHHPGFTLRSRAEAAKANEDFLLAAGMRVRSPDGKMELSELAKAIDTAEAIGVDDEGRILIDREAYGLRR